MEIAPLLASEDIGSDGKAASKIQAEVQAFIEKNNPKGMIAAGEEEEDGEDIEQVWEEDGAMARA